MIKMYLTLSFVTVSLLFSILGEGSSCGSKAARTNNAPAAQNERLAAGVWGGQHIRLEVTDGGAQIEYDCAHGTIDEPIILDPQGRFEAKGTFTKEQGAARIDAVPENSPVRYAGQVKGQTMTLTLKRDESEESSGAYSLTLGSEGRLTKCM